MRYATVHTKMWQDNKFRALDQPDRMLFLYLLTSPHGNMIGYYYLPKAYIAADTGMDARQVEGSMQTLHRLGMVLYDDEAQMVLLKQFLKYNPISNENQVKGAVQLIKELPESWLLMEFLSCIEAHCPDHIDRFRDICKGHASPLIAPSEPLRSPYEAPSNGLGMPIEEQVQDQVQDQVQQQEGVQGEEPAAAYWDRMSVGRMNPRIKEEIEAYYDDGFSDTMIRMAMDKALLANANLNYAFTVLDTWREKEIFTPEDAEKEAAEHRARGSAAQPQRKSRYDPVAFQKMVEEAGIDAARSG